VEPRCGQKLLKVEKVLCFIQFFHFAAPAESQHIKTPGMCSPSPFSMLSEIVMEHGEINAGCLAVSVKARCSRS